jgi:hypothetical protein
MDTKHDRFDSAAAVVAERPSTRPTRRPNPLVAFLEAMTPEEEASLRYAGERDRESAGELDSDALPLPHELPTT